MSVVFDVFDLQPLPAGVAANVYAVAVAPGETEGTLAVYAMTEAQMAAWLAAQLTPAVLSAALAALQTSAPSTTGQAWLDGKVVTVS